MRTRAYRGTILVVVLGILAVLAIIGATMIKVARVDSLAARSYRQGTELDLGVESALEWLEYKLVTDYYDKLDNQTLGAYDNPHERNCPIALISPYYSNGYVLGHTNVTARGLYLTSSNAYYKSGYNAEDGGHNLPVVTPMPRWRPYGQGTSASGHLPDGMVMNDPGKSGCFPGLVMYTSDGRQVLVSLTVVDLSGMYNLNYHGDNVKDVTTHCGQSYHDEMVYPTDIAPNWTDSTSDKHSPIASGDDFGSFILNCKRWGTDGQPELKDKQINYLDPSNKANKDAKTATQARTPYAEDVPFTLEDLFELSHWNGTRFTSRVEQLLPNTLNRTGEERADAKMFRRSLFTVLSFVSCARKPYDTGRDAESEYYGGLHVKADLNNGPEDKPTSIDTLKENPLRMALLGTGMFGGYPNQELDQIVANIMDFRDEDCRPGAIEAGSYVAFGVDAQPFINEVYVDDANKQVVAGSGGNPGYTIYPVYIELANPYKKDLVKGDAFTSLTVGSGANRKSVSVSTGYTISKCAADQYQTGRVRQTTVQVEDGQDWKDYVFPVELHASAKQRGGSKTWDIIIDRFKHSDSYQPTTGQSLQRLSCGGKDRYGTTHKYFGGWDDRAAVRSVTMSGGGQPGDGMAFSANPSDGTTKIARPIENRSLTPSWTDAKRGRYLASEMSFRRIGDIARVLRIGHPDASGTGLTVPERLGGFSETTVRNAYVDILNRNSYRRLTTVVTVGSPYCDNVDNDGDTYADEDDFTYGDPSGTGTGSTQKYDNLGPELYEWGKISLKTARPEVIRGLLPAQLKNPQASRSWGNDSYMWRLAEDICTYAQDKNNNGSSPKVKCPADLLDLSDRNGRKATDMFIGDGCDDDNNGAVDDWAEQSWLYGFMSNWATTRSDSFAVYGTVQLVTGSGRVEGVRHFLAVLDRVPATAYRPFSTRPTERVPGQPNEHYLGMRRVLLTWLD